MTNKYLSQNQSELTVGPRVKEVVEYRFAHPTLTQQQIAKDLGISGARVSMILNSDKVRAAYPILARRAVKDLTPEATLRLGQLMRQTENLEVSRKVTEKVLLDQKVLDAPTVNIKSTLEIKTINELQEIVKEAASIPEPCIDAQIITNDSDEDEGP